MTTTKTSAKSARVAKAKASVKSGKVMTAAEITTAAQIAAEQAVQTKTAKQLAAAERRDWLRGISAQLQAQRDLMELQGIFPLPTINDMLHELYKKENAVTELNTFDQWKEKGYQVRRGAKAYLFWGKPRSRQAEPEQTDQEQDEQNPTTKAAKQPDYFPLCYLFDISQCHREQA